MNALEKLLSGIDGGRVLDVATGEGDFAALLAAHLRSYRSITGVDIDENLLSTAIRSFGGGRMRFRFADVYHLPFAPASFETVTISNALHHFGEPAKALSEMMRVLAPGGNFVLNEMVADGLTPPQQILASLHGLKAQVDSLLGIPHGPTLSRRQLKSLVREWPLTVTGVREYAGPLEGEQQELIEAHFEFIGAYLEHISQEGEIYARLRRSVLRIKEQAYRVGVDAPPQLLISAVRQSSPTLTENRIF